MIILTKLTYSATDTKASIDIKLLMAMAQ